MKKNKIWAASVSNLSVARYFAAMDVDIISFSLQENQNINKIHALLEWIEGPKTGLELDDLFYTEELKTTIQAVQPDIVLTSPFLNLPETMAKIYKKSIYPDYEDLPCQVIIIENPLEDLSEFSVLQSEDIFLDGPLSIENLHFIRENLPHIGLVIRGGDEEKPGIKSFDELDEFFDLMSVN